MPAALTVALGLLPAVMPAMAQAAGGAPDCTAVMKSVVDSSGQPVGAVNGQQPVLFIHGLNGSPVGTWNGPGSLASQLQSGGGYFVGRFDYQYANHAWVTDPAISGTAKQPGKLADVIYCMAQQSRAAGGSGKVILVGYSMGGLAAQQAISEQVNGQPIVNFIGGLASIATPWQGTINPQLGQTLGGAGQASGLPGLDTAACNLYSFTDRALLKQIPGQDCYVVGAPGSAAFQAQLLNPDGSLSPEMKNLPPLPPGFPIYAVAGNVQWQANVFGRQIDHSGDDGVVGTGSATHPRLAAGQPRQTGFTVIGCKLPSAQIPPKSLGGLAQQAHNAYYGALPLLSQPCGHGSLPTSPATASVLAPELAAWRLTLAQGTPSSIAGTYVLSRTLVSCVEFVMGCSTTPMPIRIACQAGACTVMRTDGWWQHPHPLVFDGTAWRAAGPDSRTTTCNHKFAPGAMAIELQVISTAVVSGVLKAEQLRGTYTGTQPAGVCNNPGGSKAFYALSNAPRVTSPVPPSPAALSKAARAAVAAARSVHISAVLAGGGEHGGMDVSLAFPASLYGVMSPGGQPFTVLASQASTYVTVTAALLARLKLPATRCPVICGRYLRLPAASARGLLGASPWSLIGSLRRDIGQFSGVRAATLDGQPAWQVSIPGGTAYVAAQGPAYPLRVVQGRDRVDYSQWDGATVPPPPPASLVTGLGQLSAR